MTDTNKPELCAECGKQLNAFDLIAQEMRGDLCKECDTKLAKQVWNTIMDDESNRLARMFAPSDEDRRVTSARY